MRARQNEDKHKKWQVKRNKNLVWRDLWCSVIQYVVGVFTSFFLSFFLSTSPFPSLSLFFYSMPLQLVIVFFTRDGGPISHWKKLRLLHISLYLGVPIWLLSLLPGLLPPASDRVSLPLSHSSVRIHCQAFSDEANVPYFFLYFFVCFFKQEIEEKYIRQIHNKS